MSPSKHHTFAIFQELKSAWISSSTAPSSALNTPPLLISYLLNNFDSPQTPIRSAHMNTDGIIY